MAKKIKVSIQIGLIILLGFLRDYLFYNTNWVYLHLTNGRPNQARKEFDFLLEWSTKEILILKWCLTFLFFSLFAIFTTWIVRSIFEKKEYSKISLFVFLTLLIVSGLLYVIYVCVGSPMSIYAVIRTLMGLGQSFMPLMFLVIIFKFFPVKIKE